VPAAGLPSPGLAAPRFLAAMLRVRGRLAPSCHGGRHRCLVPAVAASAAAAPPGGAPTTVALSAAIRRPLSSSSAAAAAAAAVDGGELSQISDAELDARLTDILAEKQVRAARGSSRSSCCGATAAAERMMDRLMRPTAATAWRGWLVVHAVGRGVLRAPW
jgi:hypothetical protein